jgi:thymidylate synthase
LGLIISESGEPMKLLILIQGNYGQRIVDHISANKPQEWQLNVWSVPLITESVIDEPEVYLPDNLPQAELILHLAESHQAAQLLPALAEKTGAKGVIASIDSSAWLPLGLRNQLRRELNNKGVAIVYPEPLCSIDEEAVGFYESNKQPYTSAIISEFARHFGKPKIALTLDEKKNIVAAKILRGAPCGSSHYTSRRIIGLEAKNAVPRAGLMCLHYPCLASMQFEQTDNGVDTIMHTSGRVFNEAMEKALL